MAAVSDEKIHQVAQALWAGLYEAEFRGKDRGRFCLTREQLRIALNTDRLHASTVQRLQDEALAIGLVIIDLDDVFPCVEARVVRRYRRPPREIFEQHFTPVEDDTEEGDDE